MAICFARCSFIQSSQRHSILLAAAYIGRARLAAPYPTTDYSDRGDLLFPMRTLLPQGAPTEFEDPWFLWSEMERAAPRKDASLGLHLILALPAPNELPRTLYAELVESFITDLIAPHSLAVSYAVHQPHVGSRGKYMDWLESGGSPRAYAAALSNRNQHAHVLISGRRLTAAGIDPRRYAALDPTHVGKGGARGGVDWPRLWHHHQNAFFARHGLGLRVRPFAKFSDAHHGSTRIGAGKKDDTAVVERANRSAVSDPSQLLELVSAQPFTERDLREILDRYAPRSHPYDLDSVDAALVLPNVSRLAYPTSATGSPWYATVDLARAEQACIDLAAALLDKSCSAQPGISDLLRGFGGSLGLVDEAQAIKRLSSAIVADKNGVFSEAVHGWPSLLGAVFKVDIRRATYRLPEAGIVLLDYADTVPALELKRLLLAVNSADNVRLLLIRRAMALGYRRNPLLDVLAEMIDPRPAPTERNSVRCLVDTMANEGRIVFSNHADLLKTARRLFEKKKADEDNPAFVCPDYEFCGLLRFERLPVRAVAPSEAAIVVHCEPSAGNLPLLGLLESTRDPVLLVDSRYCSSLSALREQIEMSRSRPCTSAMLRYRGSRTEAAKVLAGRPDPHKTSMYAEGELFGQKAELTVVDHNPDAALRTSDHVSSTEAMIGPEPLGNHPDDGRINVSESDHLPDAPYDWAIEKDGETEVEPDFDTEAQQEYDSDHWDEQEHYPESAEETAAEDGR